MLFQRRPQRLDLSRHGPIQDLVPDPDDQTAQDGRVDAEGNFRLLPELTENLLADRRLFGFCERKG